jgi:glutathione S-transferase
VTQSANVGPCSRFDHTFGVPDAIFQYTSPTLVGRSSSHFTRVTRIFAAEVAVELAFRVVHDLSSSRASDYAGNPGLNVPALETSRGVWFGALNVCRELARCSRLDLRLLWPEALDQPLLANAQELTVQAMATEVSLIMGSLAGATLGGVHRDKLQARLSGSLAWLDQNAHAVLQALPPRDLSYLEVTLFCLVTHLGFRGILDPLPYANLMQFCERFGERRSALSTPYRFDAPPEAKSAAS